MTGRWGPEAERSFRSSPATGRLMAGLMLAVLVWGACLATGSYLHGHGRSDLRAATILTMTLAFVAGWGAMLWLRQRQTRRGNAPTRTAQATGNDGPSPDV